MSYNNDPQTWPCGACGEEIDHTHFYADGLGVMHHESDDELRRLLAIAAEHYQAEHGTPTTDYSGGF